PDLYAHYERTLACALATTGNIYAARSHFDRAKRVYDGIHHVPALIELDRRWNLAMSQRPDHIDTPGKEHQSNGVERGRSTLQSAAMIMLHAARPELLAREIVHLLRETDCVRSATAI